MIKATIFSIILLMLVDVYEENPKINDYLVGVWVYDSSVQQGVNFRKSEKFLSDLPGVEFKPDGKLLMRSNIGWCGTPPISYSNFEGSWTLVDSTILIKRKYWKGDTKEVWEVANISSTKLKIFKFVISNDMK